jgi:hypothetical protein
VLAVEELVRQSGHRNLDEDQIAAIMQRAAPSGLASSFARYSYLVKAKG